MGKVRNGQNWSKKDQKWVILPKMEKNGGLARIQNFSTIFRVFCSFLAIFHKKIENLGKKGHFWLFLALFGGFWGFSVSLGGRDRDPSKTVILAKNGGTPLPPKPQFSKKHCFLPFFGLARIQNFFLPSEVEFVLTGLLTDYFLTSELSKNPYLGQGCFLHKGGKEFLLKSKKGPKTAFFDPFLAFFWLLSTREGNAYWPCPVKWHRPGPLNPAQLPLPLPS